MRAISAFVIAFSTYSRIPMLQVEWSDENRRYTMCFFPLIGAAVGLLMWLWLWACDHFGLGPVLRGAVSALIPLLITGGIHMDGFMDTSDAIASWQPMERRLEILKDSHTGAFAVIGCAGYLLLFAGVYSEATAQAAPLLLSPGLSARWRWRFSKAPGRTACWTALPARRIGGWWAQAPASTQPCVWPCGRCWAAGLRPHAWRLRRSALPVTGTWRTRISAA